MELQLIQNKIYEIRGHRVMLDFDLASLYQVETKRLNEQVKRNINRFPEDFMFKLTLEEWETMWSQFATTLKNEAFTWSQNATTPQQSRRKDNTPFAFTEHGVTMLASVLRSETAVKMSIAVVRAFVALKQFTNQYKELMQQIQHIKNKMGEHDSQFNSIYEAIENLLDQKAEQKTWKEREPIGFIKPKKKK